ncbi:MAG: Gfo/Idh/MocA family oxidoreductase [Verrucomicrobia bacterium]|jgi:predicted dehydrogenase|nr:Gfo/Idh/MocA family oxidoreductase [Verrucomicrobiota bacterium]
MSRTRSRPLSRRQFLASTGLALAAPAILPSSVFGQNSPANRLNIGVVGWGIMGPGNTQAFLKMKDCQVMAACDVDKNHLQAALNTINAHYRNQDCQAYRDYREMLARKDLDAVMLAVPDHWHMLTAVHAAQAGKHIYGEKPLARTIVEQQAIVKAVHRNKITWQTGSWQRSVANFHKAAELVANGHIGEVTHVEIGLPAGHGSYTPTPPSLAITDPPPDLDYDFWVGPARMMPYREGYVHRNWRWNYNFGGGRLLDWVGHHMDIAHWGLGFDNNGPSEIEGEGEFPPAEAPWNTATRYRIELKYPRRITMTLAGGWNDIRSGTKWIGTEGWVWVDREGFEASNPSWKDDYKRLPEEMRAKRPLYVSANHQRNFIDCIRSGQPTITPVEVAHHSTIPGHLGLISMLVKRKIRWDPSKEEILDDPEASRLLTREYRKPWTLS